MKNLLLLISGALGTTTVIEAFTCGGQATPRFQRVLLPHSHAVVSTTQLEAKKDDKPPLPDFLFQEFKTAKGEVLDPYKVLKVKQTASIDDVKQAYRQLSRKYHADANRFKDVLPGRCNNKEEVRDEWERVKLAYEILRDPKLRLRYDRNVVIADPGAAMQRAALDAMGRSIQGVGQAMGKGLFGMGKGILHVGAFTLEQLTSKQQEEEAKRQQSNTDMSPPLEPLLASDQANSPTPSKSEVAKEQPVET